MEGTPFSVTLARFAEADPDRPGITDHERTVTRREFDLSTNRLARAYAALGVSEGDMVTIGLPNGIEWYEAAWACWKLGATPQPVSHRLPRIELEAIVELADPTLVVGLAVEGRTCVDAGFTPDPALSDEPLPPKEGTSWKAPTSGGSTGRPKLIVAATGAITEGPTLTGMLLGMREDGVHLCTGPLSHNGPLVFSIGAQLMGNHIVIMPRFDAEETLRLVERHQADWVYSVPTTMSRIWKLPEDVKARYDLSSIHRIFHVAAPCPAWLKEAYIEWLGPEKVIELYAGTEAQAATVITGTEWLEHRGSVGKPVIGEMAIFGPDGQQLPAGETGEVFMRSATPTYRYVGATAKVGADGWESLGDIGWMDADGYLYLGDRSADMILVGGSNVYPAEVEAALEEHEAIGGACVIGLPDDDLGSAVHALVHATGEVTDDELRAYLRDRLAPYKVPKTFERVTEPLRDDAGKVRRSALRAARLPT